MLNNKVTFRLCNYIFIIYRQFFREMTVWRVKY